MSWGTGPWGAGSPWGTGTVLPPPTLSGVSPDVAEREGGTVVRLLGTNFVADMIVELLSAGISVGTGYIHDARFDVQLNRAWVGMPALPDGTYDIRVTTDGGTVTLADAITFRLHAEEHKVVSSRMKWAPTWDVGTRYLSGGG